MIRLTLAAILLAGVHVATAASPDFTSAAAQRARDSYEKRIREADSQYYRDLQAAHKTAMGAEDRAEADLIQAELDRMKKRLAADAPREKKEAVAKTSTGSADPEAVAKAFIAALLSKDVKEAAQYVIPEERDELVKEMKKGMPPLPSDPEIKVRVKDDGIRADVFILNAKPAGPGSPPFGLDMKLSKGRWWIVK